MKKLILNTLYIALLIALFYAVKASFDPTAWSNFWTFMAGDYPELWRKHISPNLPSITHPIVLIVLAIIALGFIRGLIVKKSG